MVPAAQRARLRAASTAVDQARIRLRAAVREAEAAGGSIREIAGVLGKSPHTVQRWLHESRGTGATDRQSGPVDEEGTSI